MVSGQVLLNKTFFTYIFSLEVLEIADGLCVDQSPKESLCYI